MAINRVMPRFFSCKYTGSNAAEVVSMFDVHKAMHGCTVTYTESGGLLTVKHTADGYQYTWFYASTNTWVVTANDDLAMYDASDSIYGYLMDGLDTVVTQLAGRASFTTAVSSCMNAVAGGMGVSPNITVPGLGNANFDVPIYPPQANTTGDAVPFLTGGQSLLGSLSITGLVNNKVQAAAKLVDNTGSAQTNPNFGKWTKVRVNVANSGALQLTGANITVHVTPPTA